jgi:hypothetical protein
MLFEVNGIFALRQTTFALDQIDTSMSADQSIEFPERCAVRPSESSETGTVQKQHVCLVFFVSQLAQEATSA